MYGKISVTLVSISGIICITFYVRLVVIHLVLFQCNGNQFIQYWAMIL